MVWTARIGRCRGFGVQSPWAYRMVRYVINEHWPYYAYAPLAARFPDEGVIGRRVCELCLRLANRLQPRKVALYGIDGDAISCYIQAGCRRAECAKTGADGVNMHHDTTIVAHKYLTIGEFSYNNNGTGTEPQATTHSIPVENLLVGNSYHVLAVVNAGDAFVSTLQSPLTLGSLQQATVTKLYTYDQQENKYSDFLMASERDEEPPLTITSTNSETRPATTTIRVERVTARVDYQTEPGFSGVIKNSAGEKIATASITGAMLVNTLKGDATSYLLKRVTKENAGFNTDVIFLGDEKLSDDKTASNYVIDPYAGKTKSESDFESATYFPSIDYGNAATWEGLFITGTSITGDDGKAWNRIGYPKENVNQNGSKAHSLGIVFRAQVRLGKDENADADAGYPTFFEWEGRYYESLEAVMEDFDEHAWTEVIINKDWSTITTWGAFKSMILNNLKDGDPFGYKAYLAKKWENKADDDSLSDGDKEELAWSSYMKTTFYYENQEGTVKVDLDLDAAAYGTTRQLLSEKGVHTFKNGICYYTYWVKHANDGDDTNDMLTGKGGGVMEYATVRNNIYKLSIAGLGRIGDDVPGDAQPMINFSVLRWEKIDDEKDIELTDNQTN